jgi:hypothetical protein
MVTSDNITKVIPGKSKINTVKMIINIRKDKDLRVVGEAMLRKKSPSLLMRLFGVSYVY